MLTIHVRGNDGEPMIAYDGRPVTVTLALPGTFAPLPDGPNAHVTIPVQPPVSQEELERLASYVCGWDGFYGTTTPVADPFGTGMLPPNRELAPAGIPMLCTRIVVETLLAIAPSLRLQIDKAIVELNQPGTF